MANKKDIDKPDFENQSSMKIWYDFVKEQAQKNKKAVIRVGITTGVASLLLGGVLGTYSAIMSRDIAHFIKLAYLFNQKSCVMGGRTGNIRSGQHWID